ncbi:hypothetical protein LTR95_009521, partial [Oleoguttula sp. CCFEE 5521]
NYVMPSMEHNALAPPRDWLWQILGRMNDSSSVKSLTIVHHFAAGFYDALASAGDNVAQRQHVALEVRDFCLALRELAGDIAAGLAAQINHVIPVESGRSTSDRAKWADFRATVEQASASTKIRKDGAKRKAIQEAAIIIAAWGPDIFNHYGLAGHPETTITMIANVGTANAKVASFVISTLTVMK